MMLTFGKIVSVSSGRARVRLAGYAEDVCIDMLFLQPAGTSSVTVWMPPQSGDLVAVAFNEERPEDSVVLGSVFADGQDAPRSDQSLAMQAPAVYLGASMTGTQKASRDDHVQAELASIKGQLDAIATTLSAVVTAFSSLGVTIPGYTNTYAPGATASDSVYIK